MTLLLVRKPARAKAPASKKPKSYPWDDDYEEIVVYAPNVYESDGPQPTGILDAQGNMIFKDKEPIGFHHFTDN